MSYYYNDREETSRETLERWSREDEFCRGIADQVYDTNTDCWATNASRQAELDRRYNEDDPWKVPCR